MGNAESGIAALTDGGASFEGSGVNAALPTEGELADAFDLFDKNGRGTVATKEMIVLLRSFNYYPSDTDLKKLVAEMDGDGSGEIEFPEFLELIARLDRSNTFGEAEILAAFRYFDPANSGFVSEPEMRRMLKSLADEDEIDEIFTQVTVELDGTVNYVEFTRRMTALP